MTQKIAAPQPKVPYLHIKQIERDADLLLAEYAEVIEPIVAPPVPVEELVGTILQLNHRFFEMEKLFPYADVHGAIWFVEELIGIESGLNPDEFPRKRGRYHFTLAHEIGHWRLHREHFAQHPNERYLFDDGSRQPDVVCRSSERKQPVEWQADNFAANLLMPRKLVYDRWFEFRSGDDRPVELRELHAQYANQSIKYRGRTPESKEQLDIAVKEVFCRPLAEEFEVSREAMRIRLEALELIVTKRPATLF